MDDDEQDWPLMRYLDEQLTNAQKARMDIETALNHQLWAVPILATPEIGRRYDAMMAQHGYPPIYTTKEQPTMDSKDGTENELDRGQLLLHTHELESRCLELRRQIAVLHGYQEADVRETVGDEMLYLAGIRRRLGT